jgi:predicted membrane-bound spermidine synthase
MSGWTLLFYAEAVSVIGSLLSLNILGALVFGLIWFYVLFQIRPLYKN